jgi:hypothetical protein
MRDFNTAARKRSPPSIHLPALVAQPAIFGGLCDSNDAVQAPSQQQR